MDSIYLFRHGERTDFVDKQWIHSAPRPWDPPLTLRGHEQATQAGARIAKLGLTIAGIFASPFQRTVETADKIAEALGFPSVCVEEGLAEVLDHEWYECWACREGSEPAIRPAHELVLSPTELKEKVTARVDTSYQSVYSFASATPFTMAAPESFRQLEERLGWTANKLAESYPGQVIILVSHGGPIEGLTKQLDPALNTSKLPMCWYTGLSVFERTRLSASETAGPWQCNMYGDASHAGGREGYHRPGARGLLPVEDSAPAAADTAASSG